jgi:hypothetical protein
MICLDLSKVEKLKRGPKGSAIGRCPACALDNHDKSGNHLIVYSDGKYGCAKHREDKEHTNLIYQLIGKYSDGSIKNTPVSKQPQIEEPEIIYPDSYLDRLIKDHSYWINRNISQETIELFKGGIAVTPGKQFGRYVFPIISTLGQIHGWSGRTLKSAEDIEKYDIKKYKHLGPTSKFVYPLFLSKKYILESRVLVLTEGIGDILALFENNIKNSLMLFGVNISASVLAEIIALNPIRIIIATNNEPDNDNIGNDAALKIKRKLEMFFDKKCIHIYLPPKKDFGEMTNQEITEWYEQALKL